MASVQLTIRGKVNCGEFPVPKGTDAFAAYAIASSKGLIPEMEKTARQTLDHPMTFEALGKGLRLFEGWALRDLANFRRRCRDNLSACFDSYFDSYTCALAGCPMEWLGPVASLPKWLYQFLSRSRDDLELQLFTHPLDIHSRIRGEYLKALRSHLNCKICLAMHAIQGSTFCAELERKLAQARDKVGNQFRFPFNYHKIHFSWARGHRGSHIGLTHPTPRTHPPRYHSGLLMMQVSRGSSCTIILVEHIGRGGSHHKWSDVSC
jgi:hypothetical protein